ncbi:Cyanovirin-N [Mycena rebaudengoi]|nr:Cyanovirin-N [Mycena rebaudengoi]KAJ7248737.1 Cyanovirin-N [Mycena rebaudengoi]
MSFSATSFYIRLEGTILKAKCQDGKGNDIDSSLNLDTVLGNVNGTFSTDVQSFSATGANYGLNGHTLYARLIKMNNEWHDASIDLDKVIKNNGGKLEKN